VATPVLQHRVRACRLADARTATSAALATSTVIGVVTEKGAAWGAGTSSGGAIGKVWLQPVEVRVASRKR
jgi:hypothetical protein